MEQKNFRGTVELSYYIGAGKGYTLVNELVNKFKEDDIKFNFEKNSNTYIFKFEDLALNVTHIAEEVRTIKFFIYSPKKEVVERLKYLLEVSNKYYFEDPRNGAMLRYRKVLDSNMTMKEKSYSSSRTVKKNFFTFDERYTLSKGRAGTKAKNKITEAVTISTHFTKNTLIFYTSLIPFVFNELEEVIVQERENNINEVA